MCTTLWRPRAVKSLSTSPLSPAPFLASRDPKESPSFPHPFSRPWLPCRTSRVSDRRRRGPCLHSISPPPPTASVGPHLVYMNVGCVDDSRVSGLGTTARHTQCSASDGPSRAGGGTPDGPGGLRDFQTPGVLTSDCLLGLPHASRPSLGPPHDPSKDQRTHPSSVPSLKRRRDPGLEL